MKTVRRILLVVTLMFAAAARAHDPYEITSVVYVRSNVIELFVEMEFPTAMNLAGTPPVRDVAILSQFETAQAQLRTLAGSFFEFTAGNNTVLALTTNVELGVENHIRFQVNYAATPYRPLQFTARGLRGSMDSPYGTSLTVLDMVNQKVLGQTTLFADSPRTEFPPPVEVPIAHVATPMVSAPASLPETNPPASPSRTQAAAPERPFRPWLALLLGLGLAAFIIFSASRARARRR